MDAQQVHELNHCVVAVGRQEMHLAPCGARLLAQGGKFLHGRRVGHTHLLRHVVNAIHRAIPHDVLDVDVVAIERFGAVVHVDDAHQSVALLAKVV